MTLADRSRDAIRQAGSIRAADLATQLGCEPGQLASELEAHLKTGELLVRPDKKGGNVYLAPRAVEGVADGAVIPIVEVNAEGALRPFAEMISLKGGRFWVDEAHGPSVMHGGLPWFLGDTRPQGFMGRTFAVRHPELALPPSPQHWNDDHTLKALCSAGEDLPGNLIVGRQSIERYHTRQVTPVAPGDYPGLATAALHGAMPGSSAGGEQPKFTALVNGQSMIVKFSPAGDSPAERRWKDLLVCEHIAHRTLLATGVRACESDIHVLDGRVFLEVLRFDRTEKGRVGMVSLLVYDAEYIGNADNWANAAERMLHKKLLMEQDARRLQFLEAFGMLIGNTDRHYGNISLLISDDEWVVSPAYDVLPMFYAPTTGGEVLEREFFPDQLKPTDQLQGVWDAAAASARLFWGTVADDPRISANFRAIAQAHFDGLLAQMLVPGASAATQPPDLTS